MGFYDAKGYWRNDGDGFYDAKGNWVNPGGTFYDGKGYLRSQGDGFYDAKGNWVNPGGAYYDGKGYLQSATADVSVSNDSDGLPVFLIVLPIVLIGILVISIAEWISTHLYLTYIGYVVIDGIFSFIITKYKRHKGVQFFISYIGNFICILSMIYIVLIYAVPYVWMNNSDFGSGFEFVIVLLFGGGGIAIIQFLNSYHEKALLEFFTGVVYFIIVIILIKNSVHDIVTIDDFTQIYHLETLTLFRVFFGFAI